MEKIDCLSMMEVRKIKSGVQEILQGGSWCPCPVIKVNGKLQQPNLGKMKKGTHPSGKKKWVIPPGKEPRPAEMLAASARRTEWIVKEGSYKYQLRPCDQLQK